MSESVTPRPAGWHPDQSGSHEFRYWDGAAWTNAVSDAGVRSEDLPDQRVDEDPRLDATDGQRHRHRNEPGYTIGLPNSEGRFRGFWTTLPGILTAIAGVITAAGGILIGTRGGDDAAGPAPEPQLVLLAEDLGVDEIVDPGGSTYNGFMSVSDDSGTIVVDVPVQWSDVDGLPWVLDDGTALPDVAASSDLGAFSETYNAPGVEVTATDIGVIDVPTAMTEFAPLECTNAGSEPYDDSMFEGEIAFFTDCGGTDTVYVLLAASYKPEPERIALMRAQILTDADIDAVVRVLETFNFT
jgi:Protein of unknown function (DUF2510)